MANQSGKLMEAAGVEDSAAVEHEVTRGSAERASRAGFRRVTAGAGLISGRVTACAKVAQGPQHRRGIAALAADGWQTSAPAGARTPTFVSTVVAMILMEDELRPRTTEEAVAMWAALDKRPPHNGPHRHDPEECAVCGWHAVARQVRDSTLGQLPDAWRVTWDPDPTLWIAEVNVHSYGGLEKWACLWDWMEDGLEIPLRLVTVDRNGRREEPWTFADACALGPT